MPTSDPTPRLTDDEFAAEVRRRDAIIVEPDNHHNAWLCPYCNTQRGADNHAAWAEGYAAASADERESTPDRTPNPYRAGS